MFGTNDSAIEERTSEFQTSAYVPLEEYEKNMEMPREQAKKLLRRNEFLANKRARRGR